MNKLKKRLSSFSFRGFSVPSSSEFTELEQEISDGTDDEPLKDSVFELSHSNACKTSHSSAHDLWSKESGCSGDNGYAVSSHTNPSVPANSFCKKKYRSVVLSTQSYFTDKSVTTFKLGRSNTVSAKTDDSSYHYGDIDTYTRLNLLGTGESLIFYVRVFILIRTHFLVSKPKLAENMIRFSIDH